MSAEITLGEISDIFFVFDAFKYVCTTNINACHGPKLNNPKFDVRIINNLDDK